MYDWLGAKNILHILYMTTNRNKGWTDMIGISFF